ncbi:MAG TPA: hypothetical protein VK783_06240 [Bacteroidia bacterium]|jgi:hypothetical protein|nr:hypothetical protein [Bacteroidia bacterium]
MKRLIQILCLLLSINAISQPAKINTSFDAFTKQYEVSTGDVRLTYTGFSDGNAFSVGFYSIGDSTYLLFTASIEHRCDINKGDKLLFLLDNDSVVSAFSPIDQSVGSGTANSAYTADNVYVISVNAINALVKHPIKQMRMYYSSGYQYIDNDVKANYLPDFIATAKSFLALYYVHKNKVSQ